MLFLVLPGAASAATYYMSAAGVDTNNGRSLQTPWKTLAKASATTFHPSDSLLLRKGDTFPGSLDLKGSGNPKAPIRLGNYGNGTLPIISAGSTPQAVRLFNQQYWDISGIETSGGTRFGIYVGGDLSSITLRHIYIHNIVVHDVWTTVKPQYDSGLIVVIPSGNGMIFDDVKIDRVIAYNTNQWWGIHVGFNNMTADPPGTPRSINIRISDSMVHDTGGDLITVADSDQVLISGNVVHNGGMAVWGSVTGMYTPNAIWTWYSSNVVIELNEAYHMHTPSVSGGYYDGGAFDIDWGSENVTIQYNYAHDNDGFCVAAYAFHNRVTSNSTIRYNICSNNDRKAEGGHNGEIWIDLSGASFNGTQIYNNTIYLSPTSNHPAVGAGNISTTGMLPYLFANNIIYSTGNLMTNLPGVFQGDNNIYFTTSANAPSWTYKGTTHTGFANYVAATGQDQHGFFGDPKMSSPTYHGVGRPTTQFRLLPGSPAIQKGAVIANPGRRDFFGNTVRPGSVVNIGAQAIAEATRDRHRP